MNESNVKISCIKNPGTERGIDMASIKPITGKNGEISYKIIVSCGYTEDGKKITKNTTFHPTAKTPKKIEKEVETFATLFEKQVTDGTDFIDGTRITFSDFVKKWDNDWLKIRVKTGEMTERTREEHLGAIRRYVTPEIGHMKLSSIKAVHIDAIVNEMVNKGRSPKTIANVYHVINSMFGYAVRKGIISESPCLRANPIPKVKRSGKLHTFTQDQTNRFLNDALTMSIPHERKATTRHTKNGDVSVSAYIEHRPVSLMFRTFFTIAVFSGARRGELAALRWADVNTETRTISITRAATSSTGNGVSLKAPKTASGNRTVEMPEVCFDLLNELKQEQKSNCMELGSAWDGFRGKLFDENFVFADVYGHMTHPDTFTGKFRDILIAYNKTVKEDQQLPLIRLHDLRHSSASHLVAGGMDIQTVARRLGHSKPSFTMDTYAHSFETRDSIASDMLGNLFNVAAAK